MERRLATGRQAYYGTNGLTSSQVIVGQEGGCGNPIVPGGDDPFSPGFALSMSEGTQSKGARDEHAPVEYWVHRGP